ncbi:MAG TPA: alpha/beta fold hydrolase [Solirubrobacterales bacterium]
MRREVAEIIEQHRSAGRGFEAAGVRSFVREEGEGAAVVLLHGVPASCFLYRKLLSELSARDLHGVAFDFPGLGLAERPEDFDYTWSGLARWAGAAIDALEIARCHLVVHDIGGPIGFEWAIGNPDRVLSLTALNTLVDVGEFRRPWPMHPFSIRGLGELWLAGMRPPTFRWIFRHEGLADRSAMSNAEIDAYTALLKREDGGRAFLRIMRGFELTDAKQRFLYAGLAERRWPAQVVWGREDPALGETRRLAVEEALGIDDPLFLSARHFLQEDQAPAVGEAVAALAART